MSKDKFDPDNALSGFDKFVADLQKLREGYELLHEVYLTIGPYGEGSYNKALRHKINDYFGFDDSE